MRKFDCDVYLDLIPLVQDGAASRASQAAVEEHLKTCARCRAAFEREAVIQDPEEAQAEETFQKIRKRFSLKMARMGLLLVLICAVPVLWFGTWYGNPLSEAIVRAKSQRYIAQQYPDLELVVEQPQYSMKSTGYSVRVYSDTSVDTDFILNFGYFGGGCWDGYEDYVVSGRNTFSRISQDVSNLLEPVLAEFDASVSLHSDWPSIYDEYGYPFATAERIVISELEVDGAYDARTLSAVYGAVEIHAQVDNASVEEICGILRQIRDRLERAGLAVRTVDVTVYDQDSAVQIAGFPYESIPGEDLADRVTEAARDYEAFQAAYDAWLLARNAKE